MFSLLTDFEITDILFGKNWVIYILNTIKTQICVFFCMCKGWGESNENKGENRKRI